MKKEKLIVKMSIDADGSLAGVTLLSSSGYAELDDGALSVVQTAAPYEPLPEIYNLSRLNMSLLFTTRLQIRFSPCFLYMNLCENN